MPQFNKSWALPMAMAMTFLFLASVYIVQESEKAITLRFGKLLMVTGKLNEGDTALVKGPGLHFKLPFADTIVCYDARLQIYSPDISERILTREKKDVSVNFFVEWKIKNFKTFHTNTGQGLNIERLIHQKVSSNLRDQFGSSNIRDLVTDRLGGMGSLKAELEQDLLRDYGIELVDLRIKEIDLPPEVSDSVFARMKAERQKSAAERRGLGRSRAEAIRAEADYYLRSKIAEANQKSMEKRSFADASAARIYADAYNASVGFYQFFRTLEAYKNSSTEDDVLVLKPEGEFFKYFKQLPTGAGQ